MRIDHSGDMTDRIPSTIHLARDGQVTHRNFSHLGYQRLIRGVYGHLPDTTGLDEWESQRVAFLTRVHAVMAACRGQNVVLFGVTALQVMGVALPRRLQDWDRCHILVPVDGPRLIRKPVVAHRCLYPTSVWGRCSGLPVPHPVEQWLQLRGATIDELIEVGDGFLRRRDSLLTVEEMGTKLAELSGRPGVKKATAAMKWVRPNTDSLYETRTRMLLVRAGLPEPTVNLEVFCPNVGRLFHVDLGYEREKIAVEYDGAVHVGSRTQMEIDANRRRILQDEGWVIITVTADQLRNPTDVIRSVENALILRRTALASR